MRTGRTAYRMRWLGLARTSLAMLAFAWTGAVAATDAEQPREVISRKQQQVLASCTFLNAHPDMKYRQEGWDIYQAGDHVLAMEHFMKASRYADKASQAMVAEMLWKGLGAPADPPMAYAWADLAAERGYPQFIRLREQYWRNLGPAQRGRAVRDGQSLLAEYADAVARPCMAMFLKKARQRMRHSAMSVSMPSQVMVPDQFGRAVSIPGHRFYDSRFWDPVKYQAWQDAVWKHPPQGEVDVGDVEQVAPGTP